tara:strand:+ start:89 stop:538 length:450 start_codon:yes stop_codon:yes gene_type:complete
MNIEKVSYYFSTSFGVGNTKFFPGTLASLVTLPFVWILKEFFSLDFFLITLFFYSLTSYFFIKTCIKSTTNKDPKYIVADEHIGQSISLIFCDQVIIDYLIAFCLFRFFDIVKPFPINLIDNKVKNAFGVILDDVLAGVFVCLITIYVF